MKKKKKKERNIQQFLLVIVWIVSTRSVRNKFLVILVSSFVRQGPELNITPELIQFHLCVTDIFTIDSDMSL
jgi:hypothetical protein